MAIGSSVNYYLGTVVSVDGTPELHEILADIPGVITGVKAYPKVGMNDQPRPGDPILLACFDPEYNSYYVYEKLKENDFIGFRASGKMIDVTPDAITIGVFDPEDGYTGGERPDCSALANVTIDSSGGITIHAASDIKITEDANCNITISGNADINVSGNATLKAGGTLETDGGTWQTTNGVAIPSGNGPFCGIPFCPFTGAPQCSQKC